MEKIRLGMPVVVEGKYDAIRLSAVFDGCIVRTDGFGVFRSAERLALIRRLAGERGVVVLTDPDGAGKVIRRYLSGAIPPEKIYHLYVPRIEGKERRKPQPSKEGVLGVEGIACDTLREILARFAAGHGIDTATGEISGEGATRPVGGITKVDFYECGLTGKPDAAAARDALCAKLGLPKGMTAPALLAAVNLLLDRDALLALCPPEVRDGN